MWKIHGRSSPTATFTLNAFNVDLTQLMSQFQADSGYAGLLDLSVDLETHGATALDLRSNMDGFFGAMLRNGTLANRYAKAVTFDILHVSIPGFPPEPDAQPVQCLQALVSIAEGVGRFQKLYLEGKKLTISGVGNIDIGTGQLDVRLTPEVHDPGLVSVATTVTSGSLEGEGIVSTHVTDSNRLSARSKFEPREVQTQDLPGTRHESHKMRRDGNTTSYRVDRQP